jgi:hypothetical protein
MQDIEKEINKDIEILKNNQFEINGSISQMKTLTKSLTKRGTS